MPVGGAVFFWWEEVARRGVSRKGGRASPSGAALGCGKARHPCKGGVVVAVGAGWRRPQGTLTSACPGVGGVVEAMQIAEPSLPADLGDDPERDDWLAEPLLWAPLAASSQAPSARGSNRERERQTAADIPHVTGRPWHRPPQTHPSKALPASPAALRLCLLLLWASQSLGGVPHVEQMRLPPRGVAFRLAAEAVLRSLNAQGDGGPRDRRALGASPLLRGSFGGLEGCVCVCVLQPKVDSPHDASPAPLLDLSDSKAAARSPRSKLSLRSTSAISSTNTASTRSS